MLAASYERNNLWGINLHPFEPSFHHFLVKSQILARIICVELFPSVPFEFMLGFSHTEIS